MRRTVIIVNLLFAMSVLGATFTYVHPLPGSVEHNPETTLIVRLNDEAAGETANLRWSVVGSRSGEHAGRTIIAGATVIFRPDAPFQLAEQVRVRVDGLSVPLEFDFTIKKEHIAVAEAMTVAEAAEPNLPTAEPVRLYNGVAVPSDFPKITTTVYGETTPGRLFYASTFFDNNSRSNYIMILNNDGSPYFYRKYARTGLGSGDFQVLPNGRLAFYHYQGSEDGFHVILDHNFVEIDSIRAAHGYRTDNHEMLLLPNGRYLLIAEDDRRVDLSGVVAGGKKDALVQGNYLQEVDGAGNVYWEWRTWDHLDIRDVDGIDLRANYIDYVHLNSIAVDHDGHYVLSLRNFSEMCKINSTTGAIIWRFGGAKNQFAVNDDVRMSHQHFIKPVHGKPNQYTIFDNGNTRSPQFSRAVEYRLDVAKRTADKVWEYRYSKANFKGMMGAAQRFENGNTFIDWSDWPPSLGCEVDADNRLLFEIKVEGISSYRARRFDWNGKMSTPYLLSEIFGDAVRLIFNKFGDDQVAYYNIYLGQNSNALARVDSSSKTFKDIDLFSLENNRDYFFAVTAVDKNGVESGFSNIERQTVKQVLPNVNLVLNGDFTNMSNWRLVRNNGARASGAVDDQGQYKMTITDPGTNRSDVQLFQENLFLLNGKDFIFEFDAYASQPRAIQAGVFSANGQINYGSIGLTGLTTRKKRFTYTFFMNQRTDQNARLAFQCGGETGEVFIDNVSLVYLQSDDRLLALPPRWRNQDVGDPDIAGSAGLQNDRFVVQASGSDIWGQSDAFHFVFREIEGDAEISARVYTIDETNTWAKAGVMIRSSLEPASQHAMMAATGAAGMAFQWRSESGGSSSHQAATNVRAPYWVKLKRKNNTLTGYESADGVNWRLVRQENIVMNAKAYFGLAVTSHQDGVLCRAQFEHVSLLSNAAEIETPSFGQFALHSAFPNPFNNSTVIRFDLPYAERIKLTVFDLRGRELLTLLNGKMTAGRHHVTFDAQDFAAGVYFYRLEAGAFVDVHKMILVK